MSAIRDGNGVELEMDIHSASTTSLLVTNSLKSSFFSCTTSEAEATAAAASRPKAKFLTVCISAYDELAVKDMLVECWKSEKDSEAKVDRYTRGELNRCGGVGKDTLPLGYLENNKQGKSTS